MHITNQAMAINVSSEVARLKSVLVHTPGPEMSLVRPGLKSELLFDDIIFEEDARAEHLDMLEVFRKIMGPSSTVYEIRSVLLECFQQSEAQEYFVEELIRAFSSQPLALLKQELLHLAPDELLRWAIEGSASISHEKLAQIQVHPIPNLLFTRALAAVVGHQIILSRAATPARLRESILMDTLVHFHPLFESLRHSIIRLPAEQSIEGGDILVASDRLVLMGISERTSFAGVLQAAKPLLTGGVETVLAIDIPKQRASMHLDTIFTFASETECVVYPPVIEHTANNVVALRLVGEQVVVESRYHIKEALEEFSGREFRFIACGGSERVQQEREQWTDGANVFALAPGVIMGYDRNTYTFQSLQEHGYTYMKTQQFLEEYRHRELDWAAIESGALKLAIGFEGHELCRGRGGARCMTLPLERIQPGKET